MFSYVMQQGLKFVIPAQAGIYVCLFTMMGSRLRGNDGYKVRVS